MKRMVGTRGEHRIDGDQILHARNLGGQDDAATRQAQLLGKFRREKRRLHDRLAHHLLCRQRGAIRLVRVHQPRQELLVERAPVHPDPHRLVVADRHFDDFGELLVLLVLEADIAGIDAVFRKRLGAGRMIGEQLVADIVKIADERHVNAEAQEPLADFGTAAALSSRSTVMRTSSDPALWSAATCATVASISAVSVFVIDWTTTGAPPPTITPPTSTATEARRGCGSKSKAEDMKASSWVRCCRAERARTARELSLQVAKERPLVNGNITR